MIMMEQPLKLHGQLIHPGENREVGYPVGSLPSGHRIQASIHVYRGMAPGPCLLLLAGMHGDEINGVEILRRSLDEGMFGPLVAGTVIVAPLLNVFGFINFSRDLSDGKDINRSFPGSVKGSLASRLAGQITRELLPVADYIVDFHTGGASRYNFPQVRYSDDNAASLELARWFGAPFLVRKSVIGHSLRETATRMGKPVIVYEAGESLRYDPAGIREGQRGIRRVMAHLGITNGEEESPDPVELSESTWVRATHAGLFLWATSSGSFVRKGQTLGDIHDPHGKVHHIVKASRDAWVIGHNNAAVVSLGDGLFHLGWT